MFIMWRTINCKHSSPDILVKTSVCFGVRFGIYQYCLSNIWMPIIPPLLIFIGKEAFVFIQTLSIYLQVGCLTTKSLRRWRMPSSMPSILLVMTVTYSPIPSSRMISSVFPPAMHSMPPKKVIPRSCHCNCLEFFCCCCCCFFVLFSFVFFLYVCVCVCVCVWLCGGGGGLNSNNKFQNIMLECSWTKVYIWENGRKDNLTYVYFWPCATCILSFNPLVSSVPFENAESKPFSKHANGMIMVFGVLAERCNKKRMV